MKSEKYFFKKICKLFMYELIWIFLENWYVLDNIFLKYYFYIIRFVIVVVIDKILKKILKNKVLKVLKLISNICVLYSVKVCIKVWGWGV